MDVFLSAVGIFSLGLLPMLERPLLWRAGTVSQSIMCIILIRLHLRSYSRSPPRAPFHCLPEWEIKVVYSTAFWHHSERQRWAPASSVHAQWTVRVRDEVPLSGTHPPHIGLPTILYTVYCTQLSGWDLDLPLTDMGTVTLCLFRRIYVVLAP